MMSRLVNSQHGNTMAEADCTNLGRTGNVRTAACSDSARKTPS